ncbi:hypothetical protein KQI63_05820 [bacterium]|nr:hypothetical protein [bacterium]
MKLKSLVIMTITLLLAVMTIPVMVGAAGYGSTSAVVCHLNGAGSDTLQYLDGASDSVVVSVYIGDIYAVGDSLQLTVNVVSDTGSAIVDVNTAFKSSAYGTWSTWTEAFANFQTESTDTSKYITYSTFARYLGIQLKGNTGSGEDTEVLVIVSGTASAIDPKPISSVVNRSGTVLQTFGLE